MMDIIERLMQDHSKLRKELVAIHQELAQPNLRDKIKAFISNYEMHESIEEDILFPRLGEILERMPEEQSLSAYEHTHEKIWELLEEVMGALGGRFEDLQRTFFYFDASVESHFGHEERELFPLIREALGKEVLEELGEKADARMAHFAYH